MFPPVCVASQAITARYKKICCFLPYHSCAQMDRTESLVGMAESHGYLHYILQEMRLGLLYSLTLRFQSHSSLCRGSPTHSSSYSTSLFLPGVAGLEQKQVLPIRILKPHIKTLLVEQKVKVIQRHKVNNVPCPAPSLIDCPLGKSRSVLLVLQLFSSMP